MNYPENVFKHASELFLVAVANTASAFSTLIGEHVKITNVHTLQTFEEKGEDTELYHVLFTELKGELIADSIWAIDHISGQRLCNKLTPNSEIVIPAEEILLEVDNILAASSVTQLSNLLDVHTYGYLPRHQRTQEIQALFNDLVIKHEGGMAFEGELYPEKSDIGSNFSIEIILSSTTLFCIL